MTARPRPRPPVRPRRTSTPALRSAVYEGRVVHRRFNPVDHRFSYRIALVLLDLAEVDAVCRLHPLWSAERANAVTFRRTDYLGDPAVPLDVAVRDLVESGTGTRPTGPIAVLTQLRTWGWLFNPITTYYCYDPAGAEVHLHRGRGDQHPVARADGLRAGRDRDAPRRQGDARLPVPADGPHPPIHHRRARRQAHLGRRRLPGRRPGVRCVDGPHPPVGRPTGPGAPAVAVPPDDPSGVLGHLPPGTRPQAQGRTLPSASGPSTSGGAGIERGSGCGNPGRRQRGHPGHGEED